MLPNSIAFLLFFAAIVALYYAAPHRFRWVLLLIASFYFYSTFNPQYLLLLIYSILVAYGTGLALDARRGKAGDKVLLAIGVLAQLSVLIFYKYFNFFVGSIEAIYQRLGFFNEILALPRLEFLLPVGLSFFTFSCISYLVDVYRGTIMPERHLGNLAVYVSFFPKLLAGPIERASPFLEELKQAKRFDITLATAGLQLMLLGLFKKVVIADRLAEFVDASFQTPAFQSPVALLVAIYFYAFQIYCDFSGYSDIAIGASLVMGIRLMENFRRPYFAKSVPEFWSKRWHISLARWFKDYVYIPLGGNRVSRPRLYFNLMTVFLLSGLWHGANWTFIIWGGLNGLYQLLYLGSAKFRVWWANVVRLPSWLADALNILITFHLVTIAWVFFRASSVTEAFAVFNRIYSALPQLPTLLRNYTWSNEILLAVALIAVLIIIEALDEVRSLWARLAKQPTVIRWAFYHCLIFTLVILGKWGVEEFIYMQF
jgi:alginate O-acetyltransferase complex protein AlgI